LQNITEILAVVCAFTRSIAR